MASRQDKLVDFFVIGAQKAGTTAIDAYLREHPGIRMADRKEVHYFDDEALDWNAPDTAPLHACFDWRAGNAVVRGEATPIYGYWPGALERIERYHPRARLIMALRHPAHRAFSHWRMETRRGAEDLGFAAAISGTGRLRVSGAPGGVHRVHSYVERGFYAGQVERAISLFGRSHVLFLRTDRLWTDPAATLAEVHRFLGTVPIPPTASRYVVPCVPRARRAVPDALATSMVRSLTELYASDIARTAGLTGLSLSDWLSPEYREPMTSAPRARRSPPFPAASLEAVPSFASGG